MIGSSTCIRSIAALLCLFWYSGVKAQDASQYPYDCCSDRECLICEDYAETLDGCGAAGYDYGFVIQSDPFVCKPTGTESTCCDSSCSGETTCWSKEQYCWEALLAVPCEDDPDECCNNNGVIPTSFMDVCNADLIFNPVFCPVDDPPTLSINPPNNQVDEGDGTMIFNVVLSNPPDDGDVTVEVSTEGGTAVAGLDYVPIQGLVLTFRPGGDLTQQVPVTIIDDSDVETTETIVVGLSNAQPSLVVVEQGTAVGEIIDNDGLPPNNEPPIITYPAQGQLIQVSDDQVFALDAESIDPNGDTEGSGLIYSLDPLGAADNGLFDINATTGVLTFKSGPFPPPYQTPTDANGDSIYELGATVTDSGGLSSVPVLFAVEVVNGRFTGGALNDPHFLTWSGKMYDYMAACDLVLVHAPHFANNTMLDIHIRTKTRYDYSYIETAAIRIGDDILEVGSFGDFFLNGVNGAQHHHHLGHLSGFAVTKTITDEKTVHFDIQITEQESIRVKTFKDWVSVTIENADVGRFEGSYGMMGEFGTGELLARDGKTSIEDPSQFGAEWQVRLDEPMLFQAVNGPQYPESCQLPNTPSREHRRLLGEELSLDEVEAACAGWDPATKDACVHDVLATGDLDLAAAGSF